MTTTGQLLVLPVLHPIPSRVRQLDVSNFRPRTRLTWQHRLYTLPPSERQDVTYSPTGHADTENIKGLYIDIFI